MLLTKPFAEEGVNSWILVSHLKKAPHPEWATVLVWCYREARKSPRTRGGHLGGRLFQDSEPDLLKVGL